MGSADAVSETDVGELYSVYPSLKDVFAGKKSPQGP